MDLKNNKEAIAIELITKTAAKFAGLDNKHHLIVGYIGIEGSVKDNIEMRRIWDVRKNIFKSLASNDYFFIEDPYLPAENLLEFLYWLEKNGIPCFGPVGVGVLHPCFKDREIIKQMEEQVITLRGSIGKRFGFGILKKEHVHEVLKDELRKQKEMFDPANILNRDKVV